MTSSNHVVCPLERLVDFSQKICQGRLFSKVITVHVDKPEIGVISIAPEQDVRRQLCTANRALSREFELRVFDIYKMNLRAKRLS